MTIVDLYSDTHTKPTHGMRAAIARAEVGDEQQFQDPEVNALCAEIAELMGKEAAVFMPSGTMCNQIAFMVHCRPGEEVLLDQTAHPIHAEAGGPAALAGVILTPLAGRAGIFTGAQAAERIRSRRHAPRTRIVSIEQTSNLGGGTVWTTGQIEEVAAVSKAHGLIMHMDGARLINAVVASGVSAETFCRPFDSCWIDFSKGLGAPIGAALAGSKAFIEEAWRYKQMMGGAMRQAGIVAAAARYALRHHVTRIADDHANAKRLAQGLQGLPGLTIDPSAVQTNLVFMEIDRPDLDAASFCQRLSAQGVIMGTMGQRTVRAVTHLDVDRAGIDHAIAMVRQLLTVG